MDHAKLSRIARRQLGLFTRNQARQAGFSAYQIRRRVASGEWHRVVGPVLSSFVGVQTAARRDLALHLAIPGSVLAGPSAARCWQLPCSDGDTYLYVGAHGGPRVGGARLLYESLDCREVVLSDGASITTQPVTVFDCLRLLPESQALHLLEWALQRRFVTIDDVADIVRDRVGRRGTPRAVKALRRVADGSGSAAERVALRLLRSASVTGWTANQPIYDDSGLIGIGDIVFEAVRLVVEIDGWSFHVTPRSFQRDRERQNRMTAAGWTVLRFTWRDLMERPGYVVAQIRTALERLTAR